MHRSELSALESCGANCPASLVCHYQLEMLDELASPSNAAAAAEQWAASEASDSSY